MVMYWLDNTSNRMKPPVPSNGFVLPPKHYKIGELVAFTGLCRQTLHNYTRWGLIHETAWTAGGHRLYDETVFARLARIRELRSGRTVNQIKDILESDRSSPTA